MRVMCASTALAGHLTPLLPALGALQQLGHDVTILVPESVRDQALATGADVRCGADPDPEAWARLRRRFAAAPPVEAAVIMNRDGFGRLCTRALLPAATAAVADLRPALVLREPCEYASAIAAGRAGVRHVQLAISSAEVELSSIGLVAPALDDVEPGTADALRRSPYLTRFPEPLDPSPFGETVRYREPDATPGPLPALGLRGDRPLVYLTVGTVAGGVGIGERVAQALLDAVSCLDVEAVLTTGRDGDPGAVTPPPNARVVRWLPQGDVLARADVVVCHGGSGTVLGALAAGVPLVIVPLFADHPRNAAAVVRAGAGVTVELPARAIDDDLPRELPDRVRAALQRVLADPAYGSAAGRIAAGMRARPTLAEALEPLVAPGSGSRPAGRTHDGQ